MPARTRSTGGAVREEVDRLERDRDRDEAAAGDHARRAAARVFEPATPDATRTPAASWTVVDVGDDAEDRAATDPPAPESAASMSARAPSPVASTASAPPAAYSPRAAEGASDGPTNDARGKTTAASHVAPSPSDAALDAGYASADAAWAAAKRQTPDDQENGAADPRHAAASPSSGRTRRARPGADEPGWLRCLYLGEAGNRFVIPSRLKPAVAWIPVALRLAQLVLALVAFAAAASMRHPAALCRGDAAAAGADAADPDALAALVNRAVCFPSRRFEDFVALEFLVVATAAAFAWGALFFFGDLLGMGKIRLGREIPSGGGPGALKAAANRGVPRLALAGDVLLCGACFAAACAVAGLRTGLDDLDAGYCEGVGRGWCGKMTAAAVFAFLSALFLAPSAALNTANSVGPW